MHQSWRELGREFGVADGTVQLQLRQALYAREVGERDIGVREVGIPEVRTREVGVKEVGNRKVGVYKVGVCEVGVREVGVREVGAHEVGAREIGGREVEKVCSGKKPAVIGILIPDQFHDRLHIGTNFDSGARRACVWVRALSGLVRWMPDEGAEDVDHANHVALLRVLDRAPQGVDAAQADRQFLAPQLLDRLRETTRDMALLGDAYLLDGCLRLLARGLCLPAGCLSLHIGRRRPPGADPKADQSGCEKAYVANDLATRRVAATFLPVGPREDGGLLRDERGDHHDHDDSRDDDTHAGQSEPALGVMQPRREAALDGIS